MRRTVTAALYQLMLFQHFLGDGRNPDLGIGKGMQQIELTAALIKKNPAGSRSRRLPCRQAGGGIEQITVFQQGGGGQI